MPNLYNESRYRMLTSDLVWETPDKYLVLLGAGFAYVPTHLLLSDLLPIEWVASPITPPGTTPTGWAGSPPVRFVSLPAGVPLWRALITQVTGDPNDPTKHRLICDLDDLINAPFTSDGREKQVSFNTSLGAQGWFAP